MSFTLIELLIVVAIIAILSAIAVPNFLEAQTRSKVSRVHADTRSIATAIEMYCTDHNTYPPGYKTAPRYGLDVLTSPIAYMSKGKIRDPFKPPGFGADKSSLTYELMNRDNMIIEKDGGPYTVDPTLVSNQSTIGTWWWVASRGPNLTFGFKPSDPEFNIKERFYYADSDPVGLLAVMYDPSNGTVSNGNVYRAGGDAVSSSARLIYQNQ